MAGINLFRGDIITVNLNPTKGSETGKVRPCIVVTNDQYNARVPVIQVVPITGWSEKKSQIITNVTLLPSKQNGLGKKSIADALQTRPIDWEQRFLEKVGSLQLQELEYLDQAIKRVFAL